MLVVDAVYEMGIAADCVNLPDSPGVARFVGCPMPSPEAAAGSNQQKGFSKEPASALILSVSR